MFASAATENTIRPRAYARAARAQAAHVANRVLAPILICIFLCACAMALTRSAGGIFVMLAGVIGTILVIWPSLELVRVSRLAWAAALAAKAMDMLDLRAEAAAGLRAHGFMLFTAMLSSANKAPPVDQQAESIGLPSVSLTPRLLAQRPIPPAPSGPPA